MSGRISVTREATKKRKDFIESPQLAQKREWEGEAPAEPIIPNSRLGRSLALPNAHSSIKEFIREAWRIHHESAERQSRGRDRRRRRHRAGHLRAVRRGRGGRCHCREESGNGQASGSAYYSVRRPSPFYRDRCGR